MPSLMDTIPPPILTEMQAMKEQMEVMMNALKGCVSSDLDDLVNRTDSPFTEPVNSCPLPQKFRMLQIESYDGVKDPLDHLETFKTLMHLQGVPDEIMCRTFPTTLKGTTRIWFNRLTPNSINTFKELSAQFTSHFLKGHSNYRIVQKGLKDLPQDGPECPVNGLCTQDSTEGKPDYWILRGRCETPPPSTR